MKYAEVNILTYICEKLLVTFQAEYGDWYDKAVGFIPEVYLPPRIMKRIGKAYAKETIPKQHRKHCGLSDDKAEILFIKVRYFFR